MKFKIKEGGAMFSYDKDARAIYIDLSTYSDDDKTRHTESGRDPMLNWDLNENGEVVGIELILSGLEDFDDDEMKRNDNHQ